MCLAILAFIWCLVLYFRDSCEALDAVCCAHITGYWTLLTLAQLRISDNGQDLQVATGNKNGVFPSYGSSRDVAPYKPADSISKKKIIGSFFHTSHLVSVLYLLLLVHVITLITNFALLLIT